MSPRPLLESVPRLFGLSTFVLCVFALSACQQAAWKAGANADDLKRDEQICRAQTADDAATKQCLRGKGWTVTDFSTPNDSEDTAPSATAPTEKASGAEPATSIPAPKRAPVDPLQRQSVQTWWKAGAQAADFNVDASACLEQLGAQHTPDYAQHLYTRAMIHCLRERSWFAGSDPVYTPLR